MYSVKQMRAINDTLVAEFRANDGVVIGPTGHSQIAVLTTTGSKTGRPHVTPLAYTLDGERIVLIASKGGGPTNPSWYYNALADPLVSIELPGRTFLGEARAAEGEERTRLYAAMAAQIPTFAEYERVAPRQIPVVVVEASSGEPLLDGARLRAGVDSAHARLATIAGSLSDSDVRAPSLLSGWTRGHVLTHLARNADGLRRVVEGVLAGRAAAMYPGGFEERARDIDAGAGRSAAALADDAVASAAGLVDAWTNLSHQQWADGQGLHPAGPIKASSLPFRRLREVEVHLADLGLDSERQPSGGVDEWSDAYARAELPVAVAGLAERLPAGVRVRLHARDSGHRALTGVTDAAIVDVELPLRRLVGWILGRVVMPGLPVLRPW